VGPHRDDLVFRLDGHAAASFASQGQLRALVLAWKTAEMDLLAQVHGEEPVLLLDDVSSELDATRNEYLFEFLKRRPTQCFITTTHPRHVLLSSERVDYRVEGGVVTQQSP
jgi:DNA replication and repair protein RecF